MVIYYGGIAMKRICVVTGSASGIGAATARLLTARGHRVIGCDLRDADVIGDLATEAGRATMIEGVRRLAQGHVDVVVANAGGGPPETSLSLNFFGAVATLEGLRPLLAGSLAPRAVAVSSVASLRAERAGLVEACLAMDEGAANAQAQDAYGALANGGDQLLADKVQFSLDLYGNAKRALQLWCRRAAPRPEWAGVGILLNVVALGFYDTPAAAYVLNDTKNRAAMAELVPLKSAFPGRADEAAEILAWCTSPQNSQMTGQVLFADGGIECRGRGGQ